MHSSQCSLTLESNGNGFEVLIIPKNTFLIESILSAQSISHDMGCTHERTLTGRRNRSMSISSGQIILTIRQCYLPETQLLG